MSDTLDPSDGNLHKTIVENLADGVYLVEPDRKITYWNRGAELISGHKATEVVGRHCYDNILGHVDAEGRSLCHSACPLALTMADGEAREALIWLKHADGHRKPVRSGPRPSVTWRGRSSAAWKSSRTRPPRCGSRRMRPAPGTTP